MTTATVSTTTAIEDMELERTGKSPLRFRGQLLTTASGQFVQTTSEKPNADYYNISIYAIDGQDNGEHNYVVQIVYSKSFRGLQTHHSAIVTDCPATTLGEFDPLAVLIGFPPHQEYAERQKSLETKARRQYDVLVSAVLKMFPDEIGDVEEGFNRGQDLIRYRTLLEIGRDEFRFTIEEASLMCDALNGTWLLDDHWRFISDEIEDACRLDKLDQKWKTSGPDLIAKINRLSPLALCSLSDAVEKFWRNPNQGRISALIGCGLIKGPDSQ